MDGVDAGPDPDSPSALCSTCRPLFEPPAGFCPKCVAPRAPEASACPACGLVFAKFQSTELEPSATLATAWRALLGRWDQAAEHARFLQLAAAGAELASAGRLYRIRVARAPDDALARAGVEATVKMASAEVAAAGIRRAPEVDAPPRRRWKLAAAVLVFLGPVALAFLLLRFLGGR